MASVDDRYVTQYNGTNKATIKDETITRKWLDEIKDKKETWTFNVMFTAFDATYIFHYNMEWRRFYIDGSDTPLNVWDQHAAIDIADKFPDTWTSFFVDRILIEGRERFKKGKNWHGYMPRAMLLIQWLAVNLEVHLITLDDEWWLDIRDGVRMYSKEYSLAFEQIVTQKRERYVDTLPPKLKTKILGDFSEAAQQGLVQRVIDHGYYGRFNFTIIVKGNKMREVKPLEMKTTRSHFD